MNMKSTFVMSTLAMAMTSGSAFATDNSGSAETTSKNVDPADITRVITGVKVMGGTNGKDGDMALESELKVGGSFNKDNQFLSMLNVQMAEKDSFAEQDDFDVREVRGRWFQVFNTGNKDVTRAGYSVDLINRSNDDSDPVDNIVALGGVVKIPVNKAWSIYPNLAVVGAFNKDEYRVPEDSDGKGVQLNVFNSIYLNKSGTYIMVNPQYSYIDYDNYSTSNLLMELQFGHPLTDNKRLWLTATYQENFTEIDSDTPYIASLDMRANDDTRRFRLGVSYYF